MQETPHSAEDQKYNIYKNYKEIIKTPKSVCTWIKLVSFELCFEGVVGQIHVKVEW